MNNSSTNIRSWEIKVGDNLLENTAEKLSLFLESFKSPENTQIWSDKYYQWKIKENSAGPGFVNLAISDDEIVSSVSVTPKSIWYKGQKIRSAEIGDTYTDNRFQRRGIFAALINDIKVRAHKAGYDLIYGLPNEQSRPGYEKKCNFLSHPHFHLLSCTWLLNTARLTANKKTGWIKRLATLVSPLLNGFIYLIHFFWIFLTQAYGIKVKTINSVDESYDQFWEKHKNQNKILLMRDKTYLNFRFFRHPLAKYKFYEARKGNLLMGYLVSALRQSDGRKDLLIADWFYDRKYPLTFFALLHHALKDGIAQKTSLFSTWVTSSSSDKWLLFLSGFIPRRKQAIIFHKNATGIDMLKDKTSWHFTLADSDNI